MERTFRISEEENEDFDHDIEREVEELKRRRECWLKGEKEIRVRDTHIVRADLIRDIFKSFRERAPGPSALMGTVLLHALRNIHKIYGDIFTSCLATGCFLQQFKRAKK